MPNQASVHLDVVPPSAPWHSPWTEGTYNQFAEYIEKPRQYNRTFDLVIVDGRARVAAAESVLTNHLLRDNSSVVVVHDWERNYYKSLLKLFRVVREDNSGPRHLVVLRPPQDYIA